MQLEVVVETVEDALAAQRGGATQIEVKCDYLEYGLTPAAGMLEQICQQVTCKVICMLRPHARSLHYSSPDIAAMESDIHRFRSFHINGFMFGMLTPDSRIDLDGMRQLMEASGGLEVHCHLAWEQSANPDAALQSLIDLGLSGVRTSGGAGISGNVIDNIAQLKTYRERTAGSLDLYLAGGITVENIAEVVGGSGIPNVHTGSGVRQPQSRIGIVSEARVRQLSEALLQAERKL